MSNSRKKTLILGNFDGVHIGHRSLVRRCVQIAENSGTDASAFLLRGTGVPAGGFLTTDSEKDFILHSLGIETIFECRFSDVRSLPPEAFVSDILMPLDIDTVIFGFNYRFGFCAEGNGETMRCLGEKYHFSCIELDPVRLNGDIVSSSLIREKCLLGDIRGANELLGGRFFISGRIVHGDGRGKSLGFPTINMKTSENKLLPKCGVYKTEILIGDKTYNSLTNVGSRPTFYENGDISVETTVFDDIGDVYNKNASLCFIDFIREERKFNSPSELILQIEKDKATLGI